MVKFPIFDEIDFLVKCYGMTEQGAKTFLEKQNTMEKLDNITNELKKKAYNCESNRDTCVRQGDYANAFAWQQRLEAFNEAIIIVNTLF